MRCSLLTLSTYLDHELPADRSAEVDAHLVGCSRCQTGVGYLREESQRVRTLARVHVPDDSVHELLTTVGLLTDADALPRERQWQAPQPSESEAPPWLQHRSGRALPWAPRPPARERPVVAAAAMVHPTPPAPPAHPIPSPPPVEELVAHADADTQTLEMSFDAPISSPPVPAAHVEPAVMEPDVMEPDVIEPEVIEHEIEVPGMAQLTAPEIPQPEAEPVAEPMVEHVAEPVIAEAVIPDTGPMPPQRASRGSMGDIVGRMRDALAVRLALMRGEGALDGDVQIVSGAGAPAMRGHVAGPLSDAPVSDDIEPDVRLHDEIAPRLPAHDDVDDTVPDAWLRGTATPTAPVMPVREQPVPEPVHEQPVPEAVVHQEPERAVVEDYVEPHEDVIEHDTDEHDGAIPAPTGADREGIAPAPRRVRPGRHMRTLQTGTGIGRPAWLSIAPVRDAVRQLGTKTHGPAVGVAGRDGRLWIFGGAVAALLLVGVLIGKQVTPIPVASTGTHPAAQPSAAATHPAVQGTGNASAPPSAAATPTAQQRPTTAPVTGTIALTGAHTYGTGASGYQVQDIRYGSHPGDYRVVVDLAQPSGAGGSPKVTIGFAKNGSEMYIEFTDVTAGGQPAHPVAGGVITGAELLQPSPIPGKTVYRFTLSKQSSLAAFYLAGPTRLVIDLT